MPDKNLPTRDERLAQMAQDVVEIRAALDELREERRISDDAHRAADRSWRDFAHLVASTAGALGSAAERAVERHDSATCPHCGDMLRPDQMASHLERMHPAGYCPRQHVTE